MPKYDPYDNKYTVRPGHWITEPGIYKMQVTGVHLNTAGKSPCYEIEMVTADGIQSMQRLYLTDKMIKYFFNWLKVLSDEKLPMIDPKDDAMIEEIAVGGRFEAEFLPDEYNGKTRYKISWFDPKPVTDEEWAALSDKAKADTKRPSDDDIPF